MRQRSIEQSKKQTKKSDEEVQKSKKVRRVKEAPLPPPLAISPGPQGGAIRHCMTPTISTFTIVLIGGIVLTVVGGIYYLIYSFLYVPWLAPKRKARAGFRFF